MASRDERPLSRVPPSVWGFFAFLLATFFVWSYNGALNLREQAGEAGQAIAPQPARWAHTHIAKITPSIPP